MNPYYYPINLKPDPHPRTSPLSQGETHIWIDNYICPGWDIMQTVRGPEIGRPYRGRKVTSGRVGWDKRPHPLIQPTKIGVNYAPVSSTIFWDYKPTPTSRRSIV
jgi:hypothetical protein